MLQQQVIAITCWSILFSHVCAKAQLASFPGGLFVYRQGGFRFYPVRYGFYPICFFSGVSDIVRSSISIIYNKNPTCAHTMQGAVPSNFYNKIKAMLSIFCHRIRAILPKTEQR